METRSRLTKLVLATALTLLASQALVTGAMAAKEKFERTKPHVNIGTIGHVNEGPDQLATEQGNAQPIQLPADCAQTPNKDDGTPRPECQ